VVRLSLTLRKDLEAKGTKVIEVDHHAFRRALAKTSFYRDWKSKYGSEAWTILEKAVGQLAA